MSELRRWQKAYLEKVTIPGALCLVLSFPVQEGELMEQVQHGPVKMVTYLLLREAEGAGSLLRGEEKPQGSLINVYK